MDADAVEGLLRITRDHILKKVVDHDLEYYKANHCGRYVARNSPPELKAAAFAELLAKSSAVYLQLMFLRSGKRICKAEKIGDVSEISKLALEVFGDEGEAALKGVGVEGSLDVDSRVVRGIASWVIDNST